MAAPMKLIVKWSGQEYEFTEVTGTDTVKYLKEAIHEKTGVLPQRQKILGLKFKGRGNMLVYKNYAIASRDRNPAPQRAGGGPASRTSGQARPRAAVNCPCRSSSGLRSTV